MSEPARELNRIASQLAEIERLIDDAAPALDARIERISRWSIRQQIDHALKVLALGLSAFDGERPPQPRGINLLGRTLLALDWLPRGRARSPKAVLPQETGDAELLAETRRLRAAFAAPALAASALFRDPKPIFPHPYFGGLTARQGVRMLATHTRHHLKIVRDLRRAAEAAR